MPEPDRSSEAATSKRACHADLYLPGYGYARLNRFRRAIGATSGERKQAQYDQGSHPLTETVAPPTSPETIGETLTPLPDILAPTPKLGFSQAVNAKAAIAIKTLKQDAPSIG
ncbi:MAG: hypothetical protein N2B03_00880 [Boseongicola sp.]